VPFWVWALTIAAIVGMLVFDFVGHVRTPHAPSLRESAIWSAVYVGIAVVFGLLILWFSGGQYAGEYFAGYITEKSLSVDDLFVFVLVMASFAVPRELQQKVLLFGIAFALALRTLFIFVGAAAIEQFSWILYVFGGFPIWTAWAQARSGATRTTRSSRRTPSSGRPAGSSPPRRTTTRTRWSPRSTASGTSPRWPSPWSPSPAPTSSSPSTPSRRSSG
jgi:TerC family integral membrane protein